MAAQRGEKKCKKCGNKEKMFVESSHVSNGCANVKMSLCQIRKSYLEGKFISLCLTDLQFFFVAYEAEKS